MISQGLQGSALFSACIGQSHKRHMEQSICASSVSSPLIVRCVFSQRLSELAQYKLSPIC